MCPLNIGRMLILAMIVGAVAPGHTTLSLALEMLHLLSQR